MQRKGQKKTDRRGSRPDAVVVLGARVLGSGEPSPALRRRVAHGVGLLRDRAAPRLVLTGGVGAPGVSEAAVMARLAVAMGVAADRLMLEEESTSTREQAEAVACLARRQGWREVVVVTDRYHLPRARFLFGRAGLVVRGDPAPAPGGSDRWRWWGGAARELGAWAKLAGEALTGRRRQAGAEAREGRGGGTFPGSCG